MDHPQVEENKHERSNNQNYNAFIVSSLSQ